MRLTFGPDDDHAFYETRNELVERFGDWLGRRSGNGPERATAEDAGLAFDWKWGYGDGDLATWTVDDVDELLLRWFPRKVAMPASMASGVVVSLKLLFAFLAESSILSRGSSSLRSLDRQLSKIAPRFIRAMDDPRTFGMAKSIFAGVGAGDFDPDGDPFNNGPFGDDPFGDDPFGGDPFALLDDDESAWVSLPPGMMLPEPRTDRAEIATMVGATPVMRVIEVFRDFFGPGRPLTAAGNANVADTKALALLVFELTDDNLSDAVNRRAELEARLANVRRADDMPGVVAYVEWAKRSGAIRVHKKQMVPVAGWAKLDLAERFSKVLTALFETGPMALRTAGAGWRNHALDDAIDEGVLPILGMAWASPLPLSKPLLVDIIEAGALYAFEHVVDRSFAQRQARRALDELLEVLSLAGLIEEVDDGPMLDDPGDRDDPDAANTLETTPPVGVRLSMLARAALAPHLRAAGFDIPTLGSVATAPLTELWEHVGEWPTARVEMEFDEWVRRHSVDEAIESLSAAVETDRPIDRVAAVALAGRLGDSSEFALRALLDGRARGHALGELIELGAKELPDDPTALFEAGIAHLSLHLPDEHEDEDEDGAEVFVSIVSALVGAANLDALLEDIARIHEPFAASVLQGIAEYHPDKSVQKKARKALFKHRSRMSGRPR